MVGQRNRPATPQDLFFQPHLPRTFCGVRRESNQAFTKLATF
jgi:hypothetical protein